MRSVIGRRAFDAVRIGAGVAGVVAAHAIDYRIAYPDAVDRAHALAASGHGYWPLATSAAILGAGLAAAGAVVRGATGSRRRARGTELAAFQVTLFALIEVGERVAAGRSPAALPHMLTERTFLLGVGVQLVLAAIVAAALALFHRFGQQVACSLGRVARRRIRPARARLLRSPSPLLAPGFRSSGGARAPPLAAG